MVMRTPIGRRRFVKGAAATTAIAAAAPIFKPFVSMGATEIVHWSWLAASDGEVWAQMIKNYNDANKDAPIRMELVPEEQYMTKILAAAATGTAPDFGWGTAGQRSSPAMKSPCRSTIWRRTSASISPTSPTSRSRRRAIPSTTTSCSWSRWT